MIKRRYDTVYDIYLAVTYSRPTSSIADITLFEQAQSHIIPVRTRPGGPCATATLFR